MSIDYVVRFGERKPTLMQVIYVVEDFVGRDRVTWSQKNDDDTFIFANLLDQPSHPLIRIVQGGMRDWLGKFERLFGAEQRGFEIFLFGDSLAITLRGQDEYVQAVVEGICKVIARYWGGKVELPT